MAKVNWSAPKPKGSVPTFPGLVEGQPPSMDLMTLKTESLVGGVSVVSEIWQEPPPWVACPWKLIVWGWLMDMTFSVVSA